ncbi:hypothetical protein SVAN01_09701 [Stagonosporopsis vannaccii]|nr:hypothetical protein SVAN01_09701 [Stagonosporopsis vannaccii]
MLLFSPDASTLFFTSPLTTSIHAFSLPTNALLPPSHPHPSLPTVLAISSSGNVLLSASASPPTVLIQDLRIAGLAAVDFREVDSTSAVTCAAFDILDRVTRDSTRLVLGFRDGLVTMYSVDLCPLAAYQTPLGGLDVQIQTTRVGALAKMHRAAMGGVSAVAFVPETSSRVVSVGCDGRSTTLSIAPSELPMSGHEGGTTISQNDAAQHDDQTDNVIEAQIAVGTQTGKVLLFNGLGELLHEIHMDAPVVAVEWVGDMSAPSLFAVRDPSTTPEPGPVIMSLMKEVGDIEDAEEHGEIIDQGEVLRRQGLVDRLMDSCTGADRDWAASSRPRQAPPEPPHPHAWEQPSVPAYPALHSSLSNDPVYDPDRAIWNLQKQSRAGPSPTTTRSRSHRRRGPVCCSSRLSRSSEQGFFTPPMTRFPSLRRDKRKGRVVASERGGGHTWFQMSGSGIRMSSREGAQEREESASRSARALGSDPVQRPQPAVATGCFSQILSVTAKDGPGSPRRPDPTPANTMVPNGFASKGDSERASCKARKKMKLSYVSPVATSETPSLHNLASSASSQSNPQACHDDSTGLDGGAETITCPPQSRVLPPRRRSSFSSRRHVAEALHEQQHPVATSHTGTRTDPRIEQLSRFHTDTEALKAELCCLRNEFQELKGVLLGEESERRWRACVG